MRNLTKKQTSFCEFILQGVEVGEAHALAGYAPKAGVKKHRDDGNRLMKTPAIAERIGMAKQVAAARAGVTIETIADELDALIKKTVELGQIGPAVSATIAKARLYGLVVERAKVEHKISIGDRLDRAMKVIENDD